jgi:BlaI family transcriptional regulator, penicillinase repressor
MGNKEALDGLGELQRTVMEAVWDAGEATVHDIRGRLGKKKSLAYTTVLSTLQKLERTGWLHHKPNGRMHVYYPARTREEAHSSSLRRLVQGVFGGDPLALFQHLIDDPELKEEELAELRNMIDRRGKGACND